MQSLSARAHAHNPTASAVQNPVLNPLTVADPRTAARPDGVPQVLRGGHAGGGALGLVYSQTSGTSPQPIRIDPAETRLKRLKTSVLTSARLHCQQKPKWKVAMLTLTYADPDGWKPKHISEVLRHIRQYLKRKDIKLRVVWVMEYTKKGRPHYHVLIWLPLGISLPKPDKRGWWPHGMTKIEWARNAVGYIAKYASKGDALVKPIKGAHMHGSGGLEGDALLEQRWWKLPKWARDPEGEHKLQPIDRARRRHGGGLVIPATGEVLQSPYIVFFKGGNVYITKRSFDA